LETLPLNPVYKTGDEWLTSDEEKRDTQIKNSFTLCQDKLDLQSKIDVVFSGSTCVMVFLSQNHLICANSGDSRAIMCS
jgi:serine/threonine protein phosphatase PrpC